MPSSSFRRYTSRLPILIIKSADACAETSCQLLLIWLWFHWFYNLPERCSHTHKKTQLFFVIFIQALLRWKKNITKVYIIKEAALNWQVFPTALGRELSLLAWLRECGSTSWRKPKKNRPCHGFRTPSWRVSKRVRNYSVYMRNEFNIE